MADGKNKKKKKRTLFLLFGLIFVLGAVYLAVDRQQAVREDEERKTQEGDLKLYKTRMGKVNRIRIENEYYDMVLTKDEEDVWRREGREDFEVSSRRMTSILSSLMNITASNRVSETVEDPAEYGLTDPIARVTVESEDGDISFTVGGRAPTIDTFYLTIEGDPALYTIDSSYYYNFHRTEAQMREVEKIEIPGISSIRRVGVERQGDDAVEFFYDPETESGSFTKPYATPQRADRDRIEDLKKIFQDFTLEECQGEADGRELAEYGLDKPTARVRVAWQEIGTEEEREADLKIGSRTEDGEYYYVQLASSGLVYTMEAELVQPMAEFSSFPYIQKDVIREEDGEIRKITMEKDGKKTEVETGEISTLKAALAEVKLEGDFLEVEAGKEEELVLRVTLFGESGERELSFYTYDENHFYRLSDDEGNSFLTGRREVDAVIALLDE
ncbi:MAG: DUF4340 domain-containing protein [Lachnospiraceae bacterium]|nr:DUF4340 domain-containing protein [Lachnospiraceae bacterium]